MANATEATTTEAAHVDDGYDALRAIIANPATPEATRAALQKTLFAETGGVQFVPVTPIPDDKRKANGPTDYRAQASLWTGGGKQRGQFLSQEQLAALIANGQQLVEVYEQIKAANAAYAAAKAKS